MFRTTTAHALSEEGPLLILQTPKVHYFTRAVVLGLLVPVLLVVLVGLVALLDLLQTGEVGGLTYVVGVLAGGLAALCIPWAMGMALMAPTLSRRTRVVVDREAGVIHPRSGDPIPLAAVTGLSLRKPNALLKWMSIMADLHDAPSSEESPYRAPATRSVELVSRINELEAEAGRKLMEDIARRMNVGASDRTSSLLGGGGATGHSGGRAAHALAYLPVQGVFLFASAFLLIARRGDPRATFHAKQSLTMLLFEVLVIFVVCVIGIPLMMLSELTGGHGPHPAGIAVLLLGLIPFSLARLGGRFYAAWKAWKGELWVVPVVGAVSRRWLPAPDEAG